MSIITTNTPVITLSAVARKAFTAINPSKIVSDLIANAGDKTSLIPSDIRMTTVTARAAMGVKMTPQSFTQGMVFVLLKVAHGAKHETLVEGMPQGSQIAVAAACNTFKRGAGISELMLQNAVQAGFHALLALPAPETKKKSETLPSATITTKTETTPEKTEPHWSDLTGGVNRDADDALIEDSENRMLDLKLADQAKAVARAAAERAAGAEKYEQDVKSSAAAIVASVASRRDAEEIAREIAASLGFRLVRIAAKKAA